MMSKEIKNRINQLLDLSESRYNLIDKDHPHYIYAGFENGKKYIRVDIGNVPNEFVSTQVIEVTVLDGMKKSIYFWLLNNEFSDLFLNFAQDVYFSSIEVKPVDLSEFITQRWEAWISLFSPLKENYLSAEVAKGLVGELLFLKNYLFNQYKIEDAVNAWKGPLKFAKDFEINETWYEVKAISSRSRKVRISSLEQLDDSKLGNLVTICLDESNEAVSNVIDLVTLITEVKDKLASLCKPSLIQMFETLLLAYGYSPEVKLERKFYDMKSMEFYCIHNDFPRLQKSNLPNGIENVEYEISLASIEGYKR